MEPRIFHGDLTPEEIGQALVAEFNQGEFRAQKFVDEKGVVVQVATRQMPQAGGNTALTASIRKVEDGVAISLGEQNWLGVAASLGKTAFSVWRNPWNLINHLDDLAQDIENLSLSEKVWKAIERVAKTAGASFELSDRLRRLECAYCSTANPVGEPCCIACGAPLGSAQPTTCPQCGFVIHKDEIRCPNCGQMI